MRREEVRVKKIEDSVCLKFWFQHVVHGTVLQMI